MDDAALAVEVVQTLQHLQHVVTRYLFIYGQRVVDPGVDLLDDDLDVEERNALVVALNDELQQVMTQHLRQTNISIQIKIVKL